MAILTQSQVTQYANQAGFIGPALRTIVAIAQAESGFDTAAHNPGHPGDPEDSWGLWQINLKAHSEVTVAQATDPRWAAAYAFRLYTQAGQRFTDWGTYNSGAYKNTPAWRNPGGAAGTIAPGAAWGPSDSLLIWPWATKDGVQPSINNPYHSNFEASRGGVQDGVGMDVPTIDTPITSLTSGVVVSADFGQNKAPAGADWNFGGYVIIRSQIPGIGQADVFYRHLDSISVQAGEKILVGQKIGLSGGQTTGGISPESPKYSTGPHIDIGINASTLPWKSIGANVDPTAWLTNLIRQGPPARDRLHLIVGDAVGGPVGDGLGGVLQKGVILSDQLATGSGPVADSFQAIFARMDDSMQFVTIDWSTLGNGLHWWDFALPWQWGYASDTVTANLATALMHNLAAFALRALIVLIGLVIVIAVVAAFIRSLAEATGADEVVQAAGRSAEIGAAL